MDTSRHSENSISVCLITFHKSVIEFKYKFAMLLSKINIRQKHVLIKTLKEGINGKYMRLKQKLLDGKRRHNCLFII